MTLIPDGGIQGGKSILWPSEKWASLLYDWGNIALIVGLVIGAVSTVLIVWMGNVKEIYLRTELAETGKQAESAKATAGTIEHDNILLRGQQQTLELELSQQREKTATAERALLELKQTVEQRSLSDEQRSALKSALSKIPKIPIAISCVASDHEGCSFAEQFTEIFMSSGWDVIGGGVGQAQYRNNLTGLFLHITPKGILPSKRDIPPSAVAIQEAFTSVGLRLPASFLASVPGASIEIVVAGKILPHKK
jgi:hypothetical protein